MTIHEYIRQKVLGIVGLAESQSTRFDSERITFINDAEKIKKDRVDEYNIWYFGDGDELLNYYTRENTIDYNFEPYYTRNKRNYFWSVSSTEEDIKRTHSGQPRNIVDTLVSILRYPSITANRFDYTDDIVNTNLQNILKDCNFKDIYKNEQLPMTLVEGWGAFKINWDKDISDYPIPVYYRANNVDFVYKLGHLVGIIFKDYYTDGENQKYLIIETRSIKYNPERKERMLIIETSLFKYDDTDNIVEIPLSSVPEFKDTVDYIEIGPFDKLLAVPSIFYRNTDKFGGPGRSIFTGKIDLFDDLDQTLSQAANSVRRSTTMEYFNSDYLERDENTGMPKQPHAYDRKYSVYTGQKDADGSSTSADPVQVTQPQINFTQYTDHAIQLMMQIINGVMSPATLGIDISKRDNAEAQREKEKVTIFTRNGIIDTETPILKDLCSQLLAAYEFMRDGKITVSDYDISVKFSEFADDSFENKLEKLSQAFDAQNMSEKMFMQKLYGNENLSKDDYEAELQWLKDHHTDNMDNGKQGAEFGNMNQQPQAPGQPGMSNMESLLGGSEDEEEI